MSYKKNKSEWGWVGGSERGGGGGGGGGGGADTHWGTCELMDKGRREKRQKIIKLNG